MIISKQIHVEKLWMLPTMHQPGPTALQHMQVGMMVCTCPTKKREKVRNPWVVSTISIISLSEICSNFVAKSGPLVVPSQWRQGESVCLKIGEPKREESTLLFSLTPRVNILYSAPFSGFKPQSSFFTITV